MSIVDAPIPDFESARRLAAAGRLVLVTAPTNAAVRMGEGAGLADAVMTLPPLDSNQIVQVIERRVPNLLARSREAAAWLSGGNPQLAIDVASALATSSQSGTMDTAAAGRFAFSVCGSLRQRLAAALASLSPEELAMAQRIACLDPQTSYALSEQGLTDHLQRGLHGLEARGWLRSGPSELSLASPLIDIALLRRTDDALRRVVHLEAARALRKGHATQRYLAAVELREAGEREEAFQVALEAAQLARVSGRSVIARDAASLACLGAPTSSDRLRAALLAARAELSRGSANRAERIVRETQHLAASDVDNLEAQLVLLRALVSSENHTGVEVETRVARTLLHRVDDPSLRAMTTLHIAWADLTLASAQPSVRRQTKLSCDLETALQGAVPFVERWPGAWLASFCALFVFRATTTSRDSAEALLRRFGRVLHTIRQSCAHNVAEQGRAVIEIRAGRLHNARAIAETVLANGEALSDRTRSTTLNNLGVALTELGSFDRASTVFEELASLDRSLRPVRADQLHTFLNHAQAAWFMSDHRVAHRLAGAALSSASRHDQKHLEAEAAALIGLSSLENGSPEIANQMEDRLSVVDPWMVGIQDRYLVFWFRAALAHRSGNDPSEELLAASDALSATDRVAAAKLAVVAGQYRLDPHPSPTFARAVRRLRSEGAGWFVRRALGYTRTTGRLS